VVVVHVRGEHRVGVFTISAAGDGTTVSMP